MKKNKERFELTYEINGKIYLVDKNFKVYIDNGIKFLPVKEEDLPDAIKYYIVFNKKYVHGMP